MHVCSYLSFVYRSSRGCREGVGGSEEDGVALALEEVSEFCGGGRLSGAIDADDQKDGGFAIGAGLKGG